MTSYLVAGPVDEPISLVQAKAHLRIEDDAEDGLIESLIAAARTHLEAITGRALLRQTWRVVLDAWPKDKIVQLPVSPVIEIDAIRIFDDAGQAHHLSAAGFMFDGKSMPAWLIVPDMIAGFPLRRKMAIEIDFIAGFGDESHDLPNDLVQALLTLVAYWYENRDAVIVSGAGAVAPAGFDRLVSAYKRVRL